MVAVKASGLAALAAVKTSSLVATGWARTKLELLQRPASFQESVTRLTARMNAPFLGLVFIWSDWSTLCVRAPLHCTLVENGQLRLFHHGCLRWCCYLGPTINWSKSTERKTWGWNVQREPYKVPTYFWESTRLCTCPGNTGEGPTFPPVTGLEVLHKQKVKTLWLRCWRICLQCRRPGWIPGLGRSLGNGNPLQYSCLENSVDRGAWQATVHGVAKSRTRLSDQHKAELWTGWRSLEAAPAHAQKPVVRAGRFISSKHLRKSLFN